MSSIRESSLVIAGSRGITDREKVFELIDIHLFSLFLEGIEIVEIISGGSPGIDTLAFEYAREKKIKFHLMAADWSQGNWAGVARNSDMAKRGDMLLAIWDGVSPGTRNMIATMRKLRKLVEVIKYPSR